MNLLDCLRRPVLHAPDRPAILHDGHSVTYRQLWDRCLRGAALLRQFARPGDRVAVIMLNRPSYLEAFYANHLAHTLIVPLNIRWNVEDFVFAINDSESRVVMLDERFAALLPVLQARCPSLETYLFAGDGECPAGMVDWRSLANTAPLATVDEPDEDSDVGLFYTSGTTGGPKAAILTHRNLFYNASLFFFEGFPSVSVYLHAAPMFHLADIPSVYTVTMQSNAHAFLKGFDPVQLMQLVQDYRITGVTLVPTMIGMVLNHPRVGEFDLSSLQAVLYGATPMPAVFLDLARRMLPNCRFMQGYGMTELAPLATVLNMDDHERDWTHLGENPRYHPLRSAGRPVFGADVRVVDYQDRDVPAGDPGEVIVKSPGVMRGYWKRDDVNVEILRGGYMHTGDIGAFDELGYLYILDRKKDMIKPGGENVFSPEVEGQIMAHPAVLEAAIIGVGHPKWGETIRAIVALRPGHECTEQQLIDYCRERMTHFKCPTSVVFVEALPKGGTGKVQKMVLREQYGAPVEATA
jgi:acyl-CoA synthetase (AMP-forming)/AMP-acid ligase II